MCAVCIRRTENSFLARVSRLEWIFNYFSCNLLARSVEEVCADLMLVNLLAADEEEAQLSCMASGAGRRSKIKSNKKKQF